MDELIRIIRGSVTFKFYKIENIKTIKKNYLLVFHLFKNRFGEFNKKRQQQHIISVIIVIIV